MNSQATSAESHIARLRVPFGVLELVSDGRALTQVNFLPKTASAKAPPDRITAQAAREIGHYLADPRFHFTVPLAPHGTPFQQRVWHALTQIPAGELRTYGDVAHTVHSAARAVGQACGANPIALIVPCHRVVGAQGSLGGFMNADEGDPLAIKRWLLAHEGSRPRA